MYRHTMKFIPIIIALLVLVPTYVYAQAQPVLLSHRVNENNQIVGEVLNNSTTLIGHVVIEAALYDNDEFMGTKHGYIDDKIEPDDKSTFTISTTVSHFSNNSTAEAETFDLVIEYENTEFEENTERLLENGVLTPTAAGTS